MQNKVLQGLAFITVLTAPTLNAAYAAPAKTAAKPAKVSTTAANANLKAAPFVLPGKISLGTPRQVKDTTAPPYSERPRVPIYLPKGAANIALHKPVTASDDLPIIGTLAQITDGDKKGTEGSWVEFGPGTQWVQIDLQKVSTLYGALLWHYHGEVRVYRDIVVQVADDADFVTNVRTLYNNDQDNSSGLGAGKDREFYGTFQGQWIGFKQPVKARYIRFYSRGNSSDPQNQYIEAEVWGAK